MKIAQTVAQMVVLLCLFSSTVRAQDLARNGGFEQGDQANATDWQFFQTGYTPDSKSTHSGRRSIRCTNDTEKDIRGAQRNIELNQTTPTPVLLKAWSRAQNVSGFPNSDYSLYVDLDYTDGSYEWGIVAPFDTGTHDWQRRTLLVAPKRPIKTLKVYLLLRNHSGTAWFDDVAITPLSPSQTFDGQLISAPKLPPGQNDGWFARDVAANSAVLRPEQLGLRLTVTRNPATVRAQIEDLRGRDRTITLYYVRRFAPKNPIWWNDLDESHPVGNQEWANLTSVNVGATGGLSLYPFACVTGDNAGEAVGVPPRLGPRICRIGYNGRAKVFFVAFDVALTARATQGKRSADAAVVTWKVDPAWGFRDAAAGYYGLFPVVFARRARADGLWMPFTDPAKVPHVEDFGFAYHEGDNSVLSDDALGILSFRYTEPHSYWMVMPPEVPRTYENAIAQLKQEAAGKQGDATQQRAARAVLTCGIQDASGKFQGRFENAPWANGIVWNLNPNPRIPGGDTKARINYTKEEADARFMPGPKGTLDGEYLDSVESWADMLDYRPENLRVSAFPLTFTKDDNQVVQPLWFGLYEFIRWEADDLHHRGKLLFGNTLAVRFFALTTEFDVMGIETNWIDGDNWRPEPEEVFRLRRTLCATKPYLLLMNTTFDKMTAERTEDYFRRCMAWAVFPSMFSVDAANSPYWENPKWYDRDRPLFQKYIPVIKRLSAAGWQPVPHARAEKSQVRIERFGTHLFTVRNTSGNPVATTVRFQRRRLGWSADPVVARDMVSGTALKTQSTDTSTSLSVELPANGVVAIEIQSHNGLSLDSVP